MDFYSTFCPSRFSHPVCQQSLGFTCNSRYLNLADPVPAGLEYFRHRAVYRLLISIGSSRSFVVPAPARGLQARVPVISQSS